MRLKFSLKTNRINAQQEDVAWLSLFEHIAFLIFCFGELESSYLTCTANLAKYYSDSLMFFSKTNLLSTMIYSSFEW